MAHPRQQKSGQSAHCKHHAPGVRAEVGADPVVENRGPKSAHVISSVHVTRAGAPPLFRPFFSHKRSAHGPLAADADPCKQAQNGKLPNVGDRRAEESENGIPNDGQHERSHTPEFVSHRPPQKRQSPAEQKKCEQQSAIEADVAFRCGNSGARQEVAQRRNQHQRVNERIHAIERPASPRSPEPANLIARQRNHRRWPCARVRLDNIHDCGNISCGTESHR